MSVEENFSPELLRAYYERIFPAKLMCRWLEYGTHAAAGKQQRLLRRREFSFTTGNDVYIRYLSYDDAEGLRKDLVSKLPYKIDIGAVFSAPPSERKKFQVFNPVQRELVFDIDLTDYDFLAVDAGKVETCDACWPVMAIAVDIMERMLRSDFGFKHLLWVYSGRRGIHCWVCDERARVLSNEGRAAVADYLYLAVMTSCKRMTGVRPPLHPSQDSVHRDLIRPFFEEQVLDPERLALLDSPEGYSQVLEMLGDEGLQSQLQEDFEQKQLTGRERWEAIKRALQAQMRHEVVLQLEFTLCYPRLDVNVSKGMNHLLKAPWSAHPKTGRVCVPFDPASVHSFEPGKVPTLGQVLKEINDFDQEHKNDEDLSAHELEPIYKSSLKGPAELYRKFVRGLEAEQRQTEAAVARSDPTTAMSF